jgi:adenylate cyclase
LGDRRSQYRHLGRIDTIVARFGLRNSGKQIDLMNSIADLNHWMMTSGRCSGDPVEAVSYFCSSLRRSGVPLWRVNIGQRFANPLLIAWGMVWTPEGTETYDVTHARMLTNDYVGSAFEYILKNQRPLHKSLRGLDPGKDHISYLEFAEAGGTDYYATLLDYGDGSQHGCTFATQHLDGFAPEHLELIEAAKSGLSCALEPVTMRKSTQSLLRTYLGKGPSEGVWNGTIRRGERRTLEAVVMFTDLRGFTAFSEDATEEEILDALDGYFEVVVRSVEEKGGDVLKFMGDGILSIFVIPSDGERNFQCRQAALAARSVLVELVTLNQIRSGAGQPQLDIGIGINAGQVIYGNIGSPGRLDFTVLGNAVNVASRIEGLTKTVGDRVLATATVADAAPDLFAERGLYNVRGLNHPINIFGLLEVTPEAITD